MSFRERKFAAILKKYDGIICDPSDLIAEEEPSALFYLLADKLSYLLSLDKETSINSRGVARRRRINPFIKALAPWFLNYQQVFENRNFLREPNSPSTVPDRAINLPREPVIWVSNHGFKDDALGTVLAARRHAYIVFGNLPHFYNTFDGFIAWLIGVVMVNRKVPISKKTVVPKAVAAIKCGADLIIYPEGTWNLSPNKLMLDLWPGVYRIARATGAKIVPIVHYLRDNAKIKSNVIHTVVDDPISLEGMSEPQALSYLRDIMATWYYLMIEAYGKAERGELLAGADSLTDAWQQQLGERARLAAGWDKEIEARAAYIPKGRAFPGEVWQAIADLEKVSPQNAGLVVYARQLVAQCREEDFQHKLRRWR